jgi:hypothetical protein
LDKADLSAYLLEVIVLRVSQGMSEIDAIRVRDRGRVGRIDHLFIQSSQTGDQFDGRAGFESFPERSLLIDDGINALIEENS